MCGCVGRKLERAFNAFVSSTKTFVISAKRILTPRAKVFVCSTIDAFVILEGGLENPRERTETRKKVFLKLHFFLAIR